MKRLSYREARPRMKPGDVIAFGGKGHLSEIIKLATFCTVSHVGVILQTKVIDDDTDRFFYEEDYYRLQGDPEKEISHYNTLDPGLWKV